MKALQKSLSEDSFVTRRLANRENRPRFFYRLGTSGQKKTLTANKFRLNGVGKVMI
ncbi:hypothetical protein [Methylomonas sp. 11b]|uniref:hypothetical protein n=1 Tax=Methylomonas sp. 11b TaxID=1168169 RepID=UPI0004B04469|nr:hypothetical protein [Methylomonas sp. 11b]